MHTLHCARNIALCPDCDEPIPRGELEEHKAEVHGLKDCSMCGEKVEACKMEEHQVIFFDFEKNAMEIIC